MTKPTREQYIAKAREFYADDDINVDDNATLSEVDEPSEPQGAWVSAWVWVNADEAKTE